MKFATKPRWHYPPYLRDVAILPWEIKTSNYLQILKKKQTNYILIASTFVIHPQILIFLVLEIAKLSPYRLKIKFFMSLFFYLFTLAINLWHRKFFSADVTAVFVVRHAWACPFPQKIALGMGQSGPDLIHGSLGPPESTTQTIFQSVQPFLQSSPQSVVGHARACP